MSAVSPPWGGILRGRPAHARYDRRAFALRHARAACAARDVPYGGADRLLQRPLPPSSQRRAWGGAGGDRAGAGAAGRMLHGRPAHHAPEHRHRLVGRERVHLPGRALHLRRRVLRGGGVLPGIGDQIPPEGGAGVKPMAQSLDHSSRAAPSGDSLGRHAFTVIAALSTLLVVLLCGLWIVSYFGTTPMLDSRGFALSAPPGPHIPLPIPADYPQYVIPLRGNLERWEHA